jgi:hypothetical protein
MLTEAQVRKIALALPDAEERASYGGAPSWRTKKGMFTWIRKAPEALVVWVDSLDAKELLLEHEPDLFFTTPHYDGYEILLVRLDKVSLPRARALIEESHRLRAPKQKTKAAPAPAANKRASKAAPPTPAANKRTRKAAPPTPAANKRTRKAAPPTPAAKKRATKAAPPTPAAKKRAPKAAPPAKAKNKPAPKTKRQLPAEANHPANHPPPRLPASPFSSSSSLPRSHQLPSCSARTAGVLLRTTAISCRGGAPNKRRYSRLNWDGLSYPTRKQASAASR